MTYIGTISEPVGPVDSWPIVECNGERWHVAPVYVAPVARADLPALCGAWGCEVPTSALVDAIWRAADLKLNPHALMRNFRIAKDMASPEAYASQRRAIEREIQRVTGGRGGQQLPSWEILAGTHKDFAILPGGRTDLYGWHLLSGVPIEKGATSHNEAYVDYSQGWRPVRRVAECMEAA